jgi:hypothetical protein
MNRSLPSILILGVLLAGCKKQQIGSTPQVEKMPTVASAIASGSESVRNVPIDATFFNDCCNEAVYVAGTAHFVDNNNIQHVEVNNITGTGLSSGLSYISLSPSVLTNVFYSSHDVGILTFILNMKNTNGCSFRIKATFQVHINAQLEITIEFEKYETFCY